MSTLSENVAITTDADFFKYLGREHLSTARVDGGSWDEAHKGEVNELIARLRSLINVQQITNADDFKPYIIRKLANKISRTNDYPPEEVERWFLFGFRAAKQQAATKARRLVRGLPRAVNRKPERARYDTPRRDIARYSDTVRDPVEDPNVYH